MPDLPLPAYRELLERLEQEFTYTFGGCTIVYGLSGSYLSNLGLPIRDRVSLIYTDTPFAFRENLPMLSLFVDELRLAADEALDEEAILVTAFPVHHPD